MENGFIKDMPPFEYSVESEYSQLEVNASQVFILATGKRM
jgi:hypothetical protein